MVALGASACASASQRACGSSSSSLTASASSALCGRSAAASVLGSVQRPAGVADQLAIDQVLSQLHALARVAASDLVDRGGQGCDVVDVAEQRLEQHPRLLGGKRLQRKRLAATLEHLECEHRFGFAVRRHCQKQPTAARAVGERGQHGGRWFVDALQIVDRDHQRLLAAHLEQTAADRSHQRCRVASRTRPRRAAWPSTAVRRLPPHVLPTGARTARGTAAPAPGWALRRAGAAPGSRPARSLARWLPALARSTVAPSVLASSAHASSSARAPSPGAATISTPLPLPRDRAHQVVAQRAQQRRRARPSVGVDEIRLQTRLAVSSRSSPAIAARRCMTSNALRGRSARLDAQQRQHQVVERGRHVGDA